MSAICDDLSPAPINKVLLIISHRPEKHVKPLDTAGVECRIIMADKWRVLPTVLGQMRKLRREKIDAIITNCPGTHATAAMMLRRRLDAPAVLRMAGNMWREYDDKLVADNRALKRAWVASIRAYADHNVSRLDGILPVAAHMRQAVEAELPGCTAPVLPVPIPVKPVPDRPDDLDAVRRRWNDDGGGVVASITNFRYWKKISPMLEAAPGLARVLKERRLKWVIAGSGVFEDRFFEELERRCPPELWVRAGYISDPWSLLYCATAFVHLSEMDGMPNTVLEAQACGCPVIANDFPAMAELIDHEATGICVRDPSDAAEQLARLVEDDTLREALSRGSRRYIAENHTDEVVGRQYAQALGLIRTLWDRSDSRLATTEQGRP